MLVLAGLELGGITNFYTRNNTPQQVQTPAVNTVNYLPPTEEENNAGNLQKEEIVANENQTSQKPQTAEVIIVDASQYENEIEVRAFIANVIESGTCTYTFVKDQEKLTKTMPATADASSTPCMTLIVPRSEFSSAGTWNLTVAFESETITGSQAQEVVLK